MEQHPVPQNVTSFQFRLIGDMTIKQFGLLAAGCVLAYVFWQLPFPQIIRIFISGLFFFLGFAFAFLPFEDRPLHRWLMAFLKSVYSPTQFVYQKTQRVPLYLSPDFPAITHKAIPTLQIRESRQKLEEYLKTLPKNLPTALDAQEEDHLKKIAAVAATIGSLPSTPLNPQQSSASPKRGLKPLLPQKETPFPTFKPKPAMEKSTPPGKKLVFSESGRLMFEEEKKEIATIAPPGSKIADRNQILVEEIKGLKRELEELKNKPPTSAATPTEVLSYEERLNSLEQRLEEAEREKEGLIAEMIKLEQQMKVRPKGVIPEEVLEAQGKNVRIVTPQAAKKVGLPRLTSTPNVITGIVQGRDNSFLANILVDIKDQSVNSVRAFKTNKLGQFVSATPLENGTYTLELEDPQNQFTFDIIEVKLEGQVLAPLVIYAKSQTDVNREQIRDSLFGVKN